MVAPLAGTDLGVAILPASAAPSLQPALHILQIGRPQLRSRLEIAWDPANATNPAACVLIEHTRAFIRQLSANRIPAA
jgi:DNA-binding transcriptional LysR family regulator